jgi:hypothetical protein
MARKHKKCQENGSKMLENAKPTTREWSNVTDITAKGRGRRHLPDGIDGNPGGFRAPPLTDD